MRSTKLALLVAASSAALTACGSDDSQAIAEQSSPITREEIQEVIGRVGVFAEDSLYACILDGIGQGIPLSQLQEECGGKLLADDQKGFGGALDEIGADKAAFFDPAQVSGACNSGDSTVGEKPGVGDLFPWGAYSWGKQQGDSYELNKETALKEKTAAVEKAKLEIAKTTALLTKWLDASKREAAAKKSGDTEAQKKAAADKEALAAEMAEQQAKADKAAEEAKKDPNLKPPGAMPGPGATPCETAMQAARELLRECHRTEWKNFQCQQLLAQMNNCPDPALILVDPEQGYTCGTAADPEAVKDAVVARCQERAKYGPDGVNPCERPTFDVNSRYLNAGFHDICDDPEAHRDPDSDACAGNFGTESTFGEIDINEVIVVAMDKIGGPLIVIPIPPPPGLPPGPGPK